MRPVVPIVAALLALTASFAPAEVVFTEDWESGRIESPFWAVREGARSTLEVVDVSGDGTDHALLMNPGDPPEFWTAAIKSRLQFSRSAGSSVTMTLWGEPSIDNDGYAFPNGMGWAAGFFRTSDVGTPPYTGYEAVLDGWYHPDSNNNRLRFTQYPAQSIFEGDGSSPEVGQIFMNRLQAAVSKDTAVTVRITLGQTNGARLEYLNPAGVWTTVFNTIGSGGNSFAEPWLGFAPVGAAVYIDDIVVEGQAIFREDWQSGEIALHHWLAKEGNATVMDVIDVGGGERALAMWSGPDNEGWATNLRSTLGFRRYPGGTTVEATLWGNPSIGAAPNFYPNGAGWNFGFHKIGIPTAYVFEDSEAVLDNWLTAEFNNSQFTFTEGDKRSVFQGGSPTPRLSATFTQQVEAAVDKASAVKVRITLGEERGARIQRFDPSFGFWWTEVDTRGSGGGTQDVSTLAFGPNSAYVYIDDIVVRGAVERAPSSVEDFPSFEFEGAEEDARTFSRYVAYHYFNRLGRGAGSAALFNEEYMAVGDLWMGGAKNLLGSQSIQDVHRDKILSMGVQPDGYINTNQHFSHSHEWGWPFPLWIQSGQPGVLTAGWHFQETAQDVVGTMGDFFAGGGDTRWFTAAATNGWDLNQLQDNQLVGNRWNLVTTGPDASLTTPPGITVDAFNSPFLQLRWLRSGTPTPGVEPYLEWKRDQDAGFSPDRRVTITHNGNPAYEAVSGTNHSLITLVDHPLWEGTIDRIRIVPAPGETGVTVEIDSFFTCYDTRHTVNMPYYIITCWEYFRWTGDVDFLRQRIGQMRTSLHYQRDELGGLANNHIRTPWEGHGARPGIVRDGDNKTLRPGVGKGSNYWDLLPFGHDDMYATSLYYKTTNLMADVEQAILENPSWAVPGDGDPFDPAALRSHAEDVKTTANALFWNPATGRFVGAIDLDGVPHDYGFTFVNLEAIWHGVANEANAASIMSWLNGDRSVAGDTSTGGDIYHWRFGPRATTLRNLVWYGWAWSCPECIPWGGQVQDGGAVLGFTFYDLWARLQVLGPDNAFDRLTEIMEWERDIWEFGGYRPYYDANEGTMQGGGTAGGLGIDFEFFESSMPPAIIPRGFLGLEPTATALTADPRLPSQAPRMTVRNFYYRGAIMDVTAEDDFMSFHLTELPGTPVRLQFDEEWTRLSDAQVGTQFLLLGEGPHRFTRGAGAPNAWMVR